jgi:hypothetical protein
MNIPLLVILAFAPFWSAQEKAPEARPLCDFSDYKYLVIDHFPRDWVVKHPQPQYPELAKAAKIEGVVQVKVLVDREGDVFTACAMQGHPLLRDAATRAALMYKFKKNFGFKASRKHTGVPYVQIWLVFTFSLSASKP